MIPRFVAIDAVRNECQQRGIVATVGGLAMLVLALVLGAREHYIFCGVVAVIAGGFFGAALMALRIERQFRKW